MQPLQPWNITNLHRCFTPTQFSDFGAGHRSELATDGRFGLIVGSDGWQKLNEFEGWVWSFSGHVFP